MEVEYNSLDGSNTTRDVYTKVKLEPQETFDSNMIFVSEAQYLRFSHRRSAAFKKLTNNNQIGEINER